MSSGRAGALSFPPARGPCAVGTLQNNEWVEGRMEKRIAAVGNETVAYARAGSGAPAVVLLNGAGGPLDAWQWIWPDVATQTTVIAYNRAGIDGSSKPLAPQTSDVVVEHLRAFLDVLGVPPPYVLVAHSLGGLHANYFARRHPDEVRALVYLDATAPQDIPLMAAHKGPIAHALERLLDRIFGKDGLAETHCAELSCKLVEQAGAFPPISVIAVTGLRTPKLLMPKAAREGRARNQKLLCAASPFGRQILAHRSGHFPQITEPKLVASAIGEALAACS
jgi:alpha/beta hydrolase fold